MNVETMTAVDKTLSFEDRIAFLKHCSDLYETNGTSPISDASYDSEYYELIEIDPNHPFFEEVGGISNDHVYGTAVKHTVTMGSLSKSPDIDSFSKWLDATYKTLGFFILQHKIDGLSLSLIYDGGNLQRATTRGDGTTGIDVTKNAVHVKGVMKTIPEKGLVEVRGECFKDRADFYKNWHTSVMVDGYKNPRNFSAGSLNQLDPMVTKERGLEFIAYEVVQKDFETEADKNEFLISCGFNTLEESTSVYHTGMTHDQVSSAVKDYMDKIDRSTLPYDIDGIVFKLNDIKTAKAMGSTDGGRKPKANRAIKFPSEEKETILEDVECNVGRTGALTPVAILKPVELGGAIITRATLHNYAALVGQNAPMIGSTVVIAKKGDIIPQIIRIKQKGHTAIEIPSVCPSCGCAVGWDANKVEIVCDNINCPAQLVKKIDHWFKKLGVKGLGGGTISKLTNPDVVSYNGRAIIANLPEMYSMLDNDPVKVSRIKEAFGSQTYANILESVNSIKEVTLTEFIEALGIGRVGRTAADIVAIAPTIEAIDALTVKDIAAIDGFATIKAQGFVDGWKAARTEIAELLNHITIKTDSCSGDKLAGMKFCFTGTFTQTRDYYQELVVENGGKNASSVGKDVILCWDGEIQGGKYEKAVQKGNKIISESEFLQMIA